MKTPETLNTVIEEYQAMTRYLFETGVGLIQVDRTGANNGGRISLAERRRYIKALQKEWGAPRIVAERVTYMPWVRNLISYRWVKKGPPEVNVELTLPKSKRLQVVVAPLLLVAERPLVGGNQPVIADHSVSAWKFKFRGEDGLAIYDGFIGRCRSDPVCRIAIGTHRYPNK